MGCRRRGDGYPGGGGNAVVAVVHIGVGPVSRWPRCFHGLAALA